MAHRQINVILTDTHYQLLLTYCNEHNVSMDQAIEMLITNNCKPSLNE